MGLSIEVELYQLLKSLGRRRYLLAVSGGMDSVALFHAFFRLSSRLEVSWSVAHIHHGLASGLQTDYRHRAQAFVEGLCRQYKIEFLTNQDLRGGPGPEASEANLRSFRYAALEKIRVSAQSDLIVLAHHRDDLLETRLIRLIRGTGPQGLQSMKILQQNRLRPFLNHRKAELAAYLKNIACDLWLSDPSNENVDPLRNWMREEWLPALERKRVGSVEAFATSLESIAEGLRSSRSLEFCFEGQRILRSEFVGLSHSERRSVLAAYLKHQNFRDYGLSHINELIKRLDVEQKGLSFRLLKRTWHANARHIWVE